MSLYTPQFKLIEELRACEVESWLAAREMVVTPTTRDQPGKPYPGRLIAYPRTLDEEIQRAERGEVPLLVGLRGNEDPILTLDRMLHEYGQAVFMPVQRPGRHYMGPFAFIHAMERLAGELSEAQVYIPAGVYGERKVKRPHRAMPLNLVVGWRMPGIRSADPQTWVATQAVIRERAERQRVRKRVRRLMRETEEQIGAPVSLRRDAVFTEENDYNPWVFLSCPKCGGSDLDCPACGGLETLGGAERYFQNDAPALPARVGEDGWVRCPGCQKRFATYDSARLAGNRHHTCGQRMILISPATDGPKRQGV